MRYPLLLFITLIFSSALRAQQLQAPQKDSMRLLKSLSILPQNFYASHLGFFCKQELHMQKRTKLNVSVRLGSKDYVDYLEQKPNARRF